MIGIIDWASQRARMIIAFIAMSIIIGWAAYFGLPKEPARGGARRRREQRNPKRGSKSIMKISS